jgi:hypothetical protein
MDKIIHAEHVVENWPFPVPPGLGCVTTRQVMEEGMPILSIRNLGGDDWLFLCNTTDNPDDGMLVCLACMYERFSFIADYALLQPGFEASREDEMSEWIVREMSYE